MFCLNNLLKFLIELLTNKEQHLLQIKTNSLLFHNLIQINLISYTNNNNNNNKTKK